MSALQRDKSDLEIAVAAIKLTMIEAVSYSFTLAQFSFSFFGTPFIYSFIQIWGCLDPW